MQNKLGFCRRKGAGIKSLPPSGGSREDDENGYQIPNLTVPSELKCQIGVWGRRRLAYLKNHRRVLYVNLLTSGKLNEHLREIDQAANGRHEMIVRQMMEAEGVTEWIKADNQMLWAGKVNTE
jgi:hypothetical protein